LLRVTAPRQLPREFALALPGTAAILVLAAISLPGTSPWGIAAAWLVVIAEESVTWWRSFNPQSQAQATSESEPHSAVAVGSGLNEAEEPEETEEPEIPEGLVQQLTRVHEAADRESIHALVQAKIPANDRQAIVHLSF